MRHAYGNADGDAHRSNGDADGHVYSDSDADGYGHIHSDGDCDSNVHAYSDGNGNCHSNCVCITAAFADATTSADAAASALTLLRCEGLARTHSRVPACIGSFGAYMRSLHTIVMKAR